ncbi:DUF6894 family protein [Bosea rubneri]|uniref:DUF6894 domain-containing protein n=1 Tax=Bosea rubneri TaxID=3075434 RepID=A0ABU3SFQ9_9HYPH|nr:hypothetical protein [Bosea sp. ZW T0_25]MDU0343215.1 hypothetical protein [Bosea sp. ZW T0_25]
MIPEPGDLFCRSASTGQRKLRCNVRIWVRAGGANGIPDAKAARRAAQIATEMARDHTLGKRKAHFGIEIYDDEGATIYRAKLESSGCDGDEPETA